MQNLLRSIILLSSFGIFVLIPMIVRAQAHEIDLEAERQSVAQESVDQVESETVLPEYVLDEEIPAELRDRAALENSGPHFIFEEDVEFDEDLVGDVYVAGGNVVVNGNITGDLLVAGGNVTINGEVSEDVRMAGGDVTINGLVGKNLTAVGGNVQFGPDSQVLGSAVVGAGNVVFDGLIDGNVFVGAGEMSTAGQFGASISGGTGKLVVKNNTVIQGDVNIRTDDEFTFEEGAIVEGRRDIRIVEDHEQEIESTPVADMIGRTIFSILTIMAGGAMLLKFLPQFIGTAVAKAEANIFPTMGWGFIKLFVTPFVVIILMLTVIGIPIAAIFGLLYIVAIIMSGWFTSYLIGSQVIRFSSEKLFTNTYLQLLIGAIVLAVASRVPVFGGWVQFLSLISGLGAMMQAEKALLFKDKSKQK